MSKKSKKSEKKASEKKEQKEIKPQDLIPLIIFTVLSIVFILIGFFNVLSDILQNFLKNEIGEKAVELITPSLLIYFILLILIISYSFWAIKWIKIKELNYKELIKEKAVNHYFWIKVVIYIITTIVFVTTFYWFQINHIVIEVADPLTKDLLEPEQISQFCPSFLFVIIVLITICILRINTISVNKEFEPAKAIPHQPNAAVTAIIYVVAMIVFIGILYGAGFFDLLTDILTPTSNGNGDIIDEPYVEEEWYLYAPRAGYESGSAPYRSGPYTSYDQCQEVNEEYYYGNGECR